MRHSRISTKGLCGHTLGGRESLLYRRLASKFAFFVAVGTKGTIVNSSVVARVEPSKRRMLGEGSATNEGGGKGRTRCCGRGGPEGE